MSTHRWRAITAAGVAMAMLGLSACGDDDSAAGDTPTGNVEVTWWSHNNPTFVKANQELIARYQADHPNVKINLTPFPYDVFVTKLRSAFRTDDAPDMVQMFGTWVTDYADKGLLAEVPADLAARVGDFWPAAVGAYRLNDKVYGFPHEFNIENGGMLVDPDKLAAANASVPATWDELVTTAKATTKLTSGGASQVGFNFTNHDTITFLFLANILAQGGDYWAADGTKVDFSTPQAQAAWKAQTDLVTVHKVDNEAWHPDLGATDVFFRGQSAMSMVGPYSICLGREQFPAKKFQYVPVPSFGTGKAFAAESGWGEVVAQRSPDAEKKAAFDFLAFMQQEQNVRAWNIATCTVPPVKSLADDAEIKKAIPGIETSLQILDQGRWVGDVRDRDVFWNSIHDALTKVSQGKASPEAAITEAQDAINKMIDGKPRGR